MTMLSKMIAGAVLATATLAATGIASADTGCAPREVSIYFEKGKAEVNTFSREVAVRAASEAKACGVAQVVAEAPAGVMEARRTAAIRDAFGAAGVKVVMIRSMLPSKSAGAESVLDRGASIRIVVPGSALS